MSVSNNSHLILYSGSGYIPLEFNFVLFVLIPCGTNIFQTKKTFPQCHVYKMAAQNENKNEGKSLVLLRMNHFSDEIYPLYGTFHILYTNKYIYNVHDTVYKHIHVHVQRRDKVKESLQLM